MYMAWSLAGVVCLSIWIYLLLAHGDFWKTWRMSAAETSVSVTNTRITVVIPARDEAEFIGKTVRSLLHQSLASSIHIFVVDDGSTDGTAEAAFDAARDCAALDRVAVLRGRELPAGWTGKMWALAQGVQQARKLQPDFLLFTDADIRHSPDNLARLVSLADSGNYDVVSLMVKLNCENFAELLLIPAFVFFFFLLYPPAWIRDPRRKTAGAAGGCILIRPSALRKAGGIAAIRGAIIDDCALARAVKGSGGLVWLGVSTDTVSQRPYRSFGEIERMIARTAFNQLHHSVLLLLGSLFGLSLAYLLPIGLLFSRDWRLIMLGFVSWSLMSAAYVPMVRFYELPWLWAPTLPVTACFYMLATVHSAFNYWAGRGGEWKGRSQDVVSGAGPEVREADR
jgi:hopene-associated glycosyltransferase HpnB